MLSRYAFRMKPEIAKRLETILDKRQQQKQAAAERVSEQQEAEAKNLADFEVTKRDVILPAFQEIVDLYERRGLQIRILEEQERPHDRGRFTFPNIRLDMAALYPPSQMNPEFQLSFEKRNRQVSLYTATNSQAGPAGNVALDDLTGDWIQREFVKYQTHSY